MTGEANLELGDFTILAENYSLYRPAYSPFILDIVLGATGKQPGELTAADVGAGTGIWSRMLAERGVRVDAVEPNDAMREAGIRQTETLPIVWHKGTGEITGLQDSSYDIVTMASSFHWTDFEKAVDEFHRILRPHGVFMALWNTRHYESNPVLVDIEKMLHSFVPHLKRVSSGRSEFCSNLLDRLLLHNAFADALYLEGRHTELQSKERYIGLWNSVNDIRAQAGEAAFRSFIEAVEQKIKNLETIEAEYRTVAWMARVRK